MAHNKNTSIEIPLNGKLNLNENQLDIKQFEGFNDFTALQYNNAITPIYTEATDNKIIVNDKQFNIKQNAIYDEKGSKLISFNNKKFVCEDVKLHNIDVVNYYEDEEKSVEVCLKDLYIYYKDGRDSVQINYLNEDEIYSTSFVGENIFIYVYKISEKGYNFALVDLVNAQKMNIEDSILIESNEELSLIFYSKKHDVFSIVSKDYTVTNTYKILYNPTQNTCVIKPIGFTKSGDVLGLRFKPTFIIDDTYCASTNVLDVNETSSLINNESIFEITGLDTSENIKYKPVYNNKTLNITNSLLDISKKQLYINTNNYYNSNNEFSLQAPFSIQTDKVLLSTTAELTSPLNKGISLKGNFNKENGQFNFSIKKSDSYQEFDPILCDNGKDSGSIPFNKSIITLKEPFAGNPVWEQTSLNISHNNFFDKKHEYNKAEIYYHFENSPMTIKFNFKKDVAAGEDIVIFVNGYKLSTKYPGLEKDYSIKYNCYFKPSLTEDSSLSGTFKLNKIKSKKLFEAAYWIGIHRIFNTIGEGNLWIENYADWNASIQLNNDLNVQGHLYLKIDSIGDIELNENFKLTVGDVTFRLQDLSYILNASPRLIIDYIQFRDESGNVRRIGQKYNNMNNKMYDIAIQAINHAEWPISMWNSGSYGWWIEPYGNYGLKSLTYRYNFKYIQNYIYDFKHNYNHLSTKFLTIKETTIDIDTDVNRYNISSYYNTSPKMSIADGYNDNFTSCYGDIKKLNKNFNLLFNFDSLTGISYSENDYIGTLLTSWFSVDEYYKICYSDDFLVYRDTDGNYKKISIEDYDNLEYSVVLNRYIIFNTTNYLNCIDTYNMTTQHYASDYNNRIKYDGIKSYQYLQGKKDVLFVSAVNPNYEIDNKLSSIQFNPIICNGISEYQDFNEQVNYVGDNINTVSDNIKIYESTPDELNAKYKKSLKTFYNYIQQFNEKEYENLYYPVNKDGNIICTPNIFSKYTFSYYKDFIIFNDNKSYIGLTQETNNYLLYFFNSEFRGLKSIFIIHGITYGVSEDKIYRLSFSNGLLQNYDVVMPIDKLQFLGSTDKRAYFYNKANKSIYEFTGDITMNIFLETSKIDEIYNIFYNVNAQELFILTNIGLLIINENYQLNIDEIKIDKDIVKIKDNVKNIMFNKDYITLYVENRCVDVYYTNNENRTVNPIKIKTEYYGQGQNNLNTIDCWTVRLMNDKNIKKGKIKAKINTLTNKGTSSDVKELKISYKDFDKNSNSMYVRFQPKYMKCLGVQLELESDYPISSMVATVTMDNNKQIGRANF